MGEIYDRLKASAGESGLRNALGRWRQAVSLALDEGEIGSGTGVMEVALTAPSAALVPAAGTPVLFDAVRLAENAVSVAPIGTSEILYVPATGIFTLTPGLYDLDAYLIAGTFAVEATEFVTFHWALAGTPLVSLLLNMGGAIYPGASTADITSSDSCRMLYRAATSTNLVVSAIASAGITTVVNAGSRAIVRKLE